MPRAACTPHPTSPGASNLSLSMFLSLGHWHRDDTRRVGVQPGNNCQVGVKGKRPPHPPVLLSSSPWEAASTGQGRSRHALNASFSRKVLLCECPVLVLWKHHVTWFRCTIGDIWASFYYFIDEKAEISTSQIGRNWPALGLFKACGSEPGMCHFLQVVSQWSLELQRLEAKRAGRNKRSACPARRFPGADLACSVCRQDGSSQSLRGDRAPAAGGWLLVRLEACEGDRC